MGRIGAALGFIDRETEWRVESGEWRVESGEEQSRAARREFSQGLVVMFGRRLVSFFRISPTPKVSSSANPSVESKTKSLGRNAASFILITVTGGVALSVLDDLSIYRDCSCKAMEKVAKNQEIAAVIGEPVVSGPWYNASIAIARQRRSATCTFPISGPKGDGVLRLRAIHYGGTGWFSFLRHRGWEVLILDALVHVPSNEEKQRTLRINLFGDESPPCKACSTSCKPPEAKSPDQK